ncbi:stress-induced acidophilic repeat protein [Kushneria sinocarnis]|uniref:Stress-induced acidophilic repeat protein n=1 Tax=Kushneria sinocarnis TaxID=595502 RepID=A0A420X1D6_9GAMM|nr:stress-induced acidophilic repeat protein [Kushneria sinocarnis]
MDMTQHRGDSNSFADDRDKAARAGRKGGRNGRGR